MAWSAAVKDKVLVKCGRHCCICHKFCGLKMELHHIILKSEGGEETVENCIPLCFDCHADQKSYDHNHPKGTKYSRKELKGHREKWYGLVDQNLGTGTGEHLEQDKHLFLDFYRKLPPKPTIWYLQQIDFNARKFRLDNLNAIETFVIERGLEPWIEFFDSDIQTLYSELFGLMIEFDEMIRHQTYDFKDGEYYTQCVPREWEISDPERYNRVVKTLNELADKIVNTYTALVKLARKKLGVIIPLENDQSLEEIEKSD